MYALEADALIIVHERKALAVVFVDRDVGQGRARIRLDE
jgi:hypothetical protein